jgi:hypothetical protein
LSATPASQEALQSRPDLDKNAKLYSNNNYSKKARDLAQAIENLPSKHQALSSKPQSPVLSKKKKEGNCDTSYNMDEP